MLDDPPAVAARLGTHCLLDLFGVDDAMLNDPELLISLLCRAAGVAGATVLSSHSHRFEPHGVSALCVLAESHISIHTWPELGTASVDVYTCGSKCAPRLACDAIVEAMRPHHHDLVVVARGQMSRTTRGFTG